MKETFKWLSEKEASEFLKVDEKILELLRECGYFKPGSHWRSSTDAGQLPWKPKVFYRINECKEFLKSFNFNDIKFNGITA